MTQQELMQLLHYDPVTGKFTWLQPTTKQIKAGDEAGFCAGQYVQIRIKGVLYYAHRLAVLYMTGTMPPMLVDHDNRKKSDNRWDNLKAVTPLTNTRNACLSKNNSSGINGVVWDAKKKKWMARITINRANKFLGYFHDITDATTARRAAEIAHGFHPNHGR